jgi:REP element-mobilizing transposase RayT
MILSLPKDVSLSAVMRDLKKYTSVRIKELILNEPKYRNILESLRPFFPHDGKRTFKLWQDRFDDLGLFNEEVYVTKFNYILYNPVKASLCENPEDYLWSSFYRPKNGRQV